MRRKKQRLSYEEGTSVVRSQTMRHVEQKGDTKVITEEVRTHYKTQSALLEEESIKQITSMLEEDHLRTLAQSPLTISTECLFIGKRCRQVAKSIHEVYSSLTPQDMLITSGEGIYRKWAYKSSSMGFTVKLSWLQCLEIAKYMYSNEVAMYNNELTALVYRNRDGSKKATVRGVEYTVVNEEDFVDYELDLYPGTEHEFVSAFLVDRLIDRLAYACWNPEYLESNPWPVCSSPIGEVTQSTVEPSVSLSVAEDITLCFPKSSFPEAAFCMMLPCIEFTVVTSKIPVKLMLVLPSGKTMYDQRLTHDQHVLVRTMDINPVLVHRKKAIVEACGLRAEIGDETYYSDY